MEMQMRWRGVEGPSFKVQHCWFSDYAGWRLRWSGKVKMNMKLHEAKNNHAAKTKKVLIIYIGLVFLFFFSSSMLNANTWSPNFQINLLRISQSNLINMTKIELMHCSKAVQWAQTLVCPSMKRLIPHLLHFRCRVALLPHICPRKEKRGKRVVVGDSLLIFKR